MNKTPQTPVLLSTVQAAKMLNRKPQTLRAWSCTGTGPLKPIKLGKRGRLLWRHSDILDIINGAVDN